MKQLVASKLIRSCESRRSRRLHVLTKACCISKSYLARPGSYDLSFSLRDDAGGKGSSIEATVNIPRVSAGSLSSPIPVYEVVPRSSLDSLPRIVPTPRATLTLGQDSTLSVYIEGYGTGSVLPLRASVFGENTSTPVWSDTTSLTRRGALFSGVMNIPVARLGVGALTLAVASIGGSDTTKAPVFVTFGEDLPVATFTEMVNYLRYFGSPARLQSLRDAPPDARAAAWAAFLRETDPDPGDAGQRSAARLFRAHCAGQHAIP